MLSLIYLFQLLPLCTAMEWRLLAKGMKGIYVNKMENSVAQLLVFADSVLLLLTVIKMEGMQDNERARTCLDYCVRNLGLILKVCTKWHGKDYRIFSNLIRTSFCRPVLFLRHVHRLYHLAKILLYIANLICTSFLPPCIVLTARTPALSFGQNPALHRESNPHLVFAALYCSYGTYTGSIIGSKSCSGSRI
jgi:hypothetical protein